MAAGRALKLTALDQATQLHLFVAMFGRLSPVIIPAVDQKATLQPKLGRLRPIEEV